MFFNIIHTRIRYVFAILVLVLITVILKVFYIQVFQYNSFIKLQNKQKRPCSSPGCPELTDGRFCPEHAKKEASRYADGYIIKDFFSFWGERMHICPGGAMMRTDVVKATGGMREDLRITEDLEFWGYSALFGKWGLIPEVLFMGCGAQTVTSREDWIRRMKRRWDNAPTVAEWEKRLVKKCPSLLQDKSYHIVQGAIARNLAYCQLLSGRTKLARKETIKYSKYITKDSIGKLMGLAKLSPFTWWGLCKFLKWREWHRK